MRRPGWWLVTICAGLLLACGYALLHRAGDERAKVAAARRGVAALSEVLETYRLNNADYPTTLRELTQRQPCGLEPLLDEEALTDPWGRPYEYDPDHSRSDTLKPLVWSSGPQPGNGEGVIGNWQRPGGE
jgi:general secretion pathway protein G